jgi:ribosomal protein S18 acetylase RimI-like enzyme
MGDMAFMIRRAELSDWETYRGIRLRSLREEPAAYASQYEIERHYTADLWKQWMGNGGTFLAFDDDQVLVGTATALRAGDGDTLVVGMYVAPEVRGQGCPQLLLDAIADLASRRQDGRLVLEVSESNLRAASCYRSYGFVETGRRRGMERDPTIIEIELGLPLGD